MTVASVKLGVLDVNTVSKPEVELRLRFDSVGDGTVVAIP